MSEFQISVEHAPMASTIVTTTDADENYARALAQFHYNLRLALGTPVVTVAIIQDGRVFDVYEGGGVWSSQRDFGAD